MTQEELNKIVEQHQHWMFHFFRTREEAENY